MKAVKATAYAFRVGTGAIAAAICALSSTIGFAGETLDRVLATKTLVLAVDEEYPPFAARGHDGEMKGLDIAVARVLAARLGVELEIVTPGWNAITAGGWRGRWDIAMSGIEPTAERAARIAFAAVYADAPAVILVRAERADLAGPADLRGKRIGAQAGSAHEAYLRGAPAPDGPFATTAEVEIAEPVIVAFETEALGIEALADGDGIDAMIVGRLAAQDAIDIGKPVRVVGPPLFRQPLAIAVDKGDLAFAARIAAAVESLRADGTLARLSLEHLGVDAAPPAP